MKEENVGKITAKFTIKLILWFLLIDIIAIVISMTGMAKDAENMGNTGLEAAKALNSMITKIVVGDILAVLVATFFATKKIKKKFEITENNRSKVLRNISIVLIIMTIILVGLHCFIKNKVLEMALEDSTYTIDDIKEAIDDLDEYAKKHVISKNDKDFLKEFKGFMTLANVFAFDGIAFLVMIPVEMITLKSKEVKEEQQVA